MIVIGKMQSFQEDTEKDDLCTYNFNIIYYYYLSQVERHFVDEQ